MLRIDGVNRAVERAQVLQHGTSNTTGLLRGPDDGHGFRRENRVERIPARLPQNILGERKPCARGCAHGLGRMTSTGRLLWAMTACATEPRKALAGPDRP